MVGINRTMSEDVWDPAIDAPCWDARDPGIPTIASCRGGAFQRSLPVIKTRHVGWFFRRVGYWFWRHLEIQHEQDNQRPFGVRIEQFGSICSWSKMTLKSQCRILQGSILNRTLKWNPKPPNDLDLLSLGDMFWMKYPCHEIQQGFCT